MQEKWLPVAGYEGLYEVSDSGRVRSLGRLRPHSSGKCMERIAARILAPALAGKGYLLVGLYRDGQPRKLCYVHRLVAEAFLPPSDLPQVNHKDLDKTNNKAVNLEWVTAQGNAQHAAAGGRLSIQHLYGRTLAVNNPRKAKKLSIAIAAEVRAACAHGEKHGDIGRRFGITVGTVSRIKRGVLWAVPPAARDDIPY